MPRRTPFLLATLVSSLLVGGLGAAPAAHAAMTCLEGTGGLDLDGGGRDVVIGLPSYDVTTDGGKVTDAGAFVVYSNVVANGRLQKPTMTKVYTAAQFGLPVQAGARFGAAVLGVGPNEPDFEGCGHLMVGAPGQNVDGLKGAGAVHVIDASDGGLSLTRSTDQRDLPTEAGPPQDRAGFGSRLGGLNIHRIAIGAPGRDIDGRSDAGGVATLQYNDKEGRAYLDGWLPGRAAGDELGSGPLTWAMADDRAILAAGVPGADVGGVQDAGAVAITQWEKDGADPSPVWMSQNSPGAAGAAEPDDRYGSALAMTVAPDFAVTVAVGVPGESVGTLPNAGMVSYLGVPASPAAPTGLAATLTQNTPGVVGTLERDDRFGAALATGQLSGAADTRHVAVGADGEAIGATEQAGAVTVNPVGPSLLPTGDGISWDQHKTTVPGTAEAGDRFGGTVTTNPGIANTERDLTIVTSPGEDMGSVPDAGRATVGWFGNAGTVLDLAVPGPQAGAGGSMVAAPYVRG